jgi:predicted nucleotidyltransferase
VDPLARCTWPPLAEPYATALREAVAYIFGRWEPIGIVAAGTVVRGTPGPSSDLDLHVLHRRPERQRVQRFFHGVPAELFVNPPERVPGYFASERRTGRPVTAHMLATGAVVYAAGPVLEELRERAAATLAAGPEASPAVLTGTRYAAATWLEDAEDVAAEDPELGAALLCRAVEGAVEHAFWAARRWQPRYKDTQRALEALDGALARDTRAFYRTADPAARRALARGIVERSVGATGFFEWESEAEAVTP